MRTEECRAAGAEERTPIRVGDRVTFHGEVAIMSAVGDPWMIVRLDSGHTVACYVTDVLVTTDAQNTEKR